MRLFHAAIGEILLGFIVAMAQTGGSPWQGVPLVSMLRGVPAIVEQIEERTTKLPDGRSQTKIVESKIYRDHEGKCRIETKAPFPLSEIILLADPMEKCVTLLVPSAKIAHTMKDDSALGLGFAWVGIPMSGKNRKLENIGKRTIDGIEFEGERMTVTSDNDPDVVTVDERWISKELGLTALIDETSPTQHYSARIQTVVRKDPDPGLFIIPTDYTIRNMEDDGKDHPLK